MCPVFRVTAEHQIRELINLIQLLERCLTLADSTPAERAEWRADLTDARTRLSGLLVPEHDGAVLARRLATPAGESAAPAAPMAPAGSDFH
jgi:hypothetical protein